MKISQDICGLIHTAPFEIIFFARMTNKHLQFLQKKDFTGFDYILTGEIYSINIRCRNLTLAYRIYSFLLELHFDFVLDGENNTITINNLASFRTNNEGHLRFVNLLNLKTEIQLEKSGHSIVIEESLESRSTLFTIDNALEEATEKTAAHRRSVFLQSKKV